MTYYVATIARYVLVQADSEADARRKGEMLLGAVPSVVRQPRESEIDLQRFDDEKHAEEYNAALTTLKVDVKVLNNWFPAGHTVFVTGRPGMTTGYCCRMHHQRHKPGYTDAVLSEDQIVVTEAVQAK